MSPILNDDSSLNPQFQEAEPFPPFEDLSFEPLNTQKIVEKQAAPKKKPFQLIAPQNLNDSEIYTEHFGTARTEKIADLVEVLLRNRFDNSRSIRAVRRPDGRIVNITGQRLKLAAIEAGIEFVPIVIEAFEDDKVELEEMILSNLVYDNQRLPVGLATAVRLIQLVRRRDVKRGRPASDKQSEIRSPGQSNLLDDGTNPDKSRAKYYAALLKISADKFIKINYVINNGTAEEVKDLDDGVRAAKTMYKVVKARVDGERQKSPRKTKRAKPAAEPLTIAEILGHRDLRSTKRYTHATSSSKRRAIDSLDAAQTKCPKFVPKQEKQAA